MVLFTSFSTCQNIVSEIYDQNKFETLGFYALAAIYITVAFCSPFSAVLISLLGPRNSMRIGSFCYLIWVLSGLLPVTVTYTEVSKEIVWVVMLLAGVINGFGASILWVGQGKYVTDCSTPENSGFNFGIFWGLFMVSQILGSLIGIFILGKFSHLIFFIVMGGFALVGWISFLLLVKPNAKEDEQKSKNDDEDQK